MADIDLKGFTKLGDSTLVNDIKENMISFFDWGLLKKDNYINISIPSTGVYGGNEHQLRLVDDPRYTAGQVWEGFRSNWVWESGVTGTDGPPLVSSETQILVSPEFMSIVHFIQLQQLVLMRTM